MVPTRENVRTYLLAWNLSRIMLCRLCGTSWNFTISTTVCVGVRARNSVYAEFKHAEIYRTQAANVQTRTKYSEQCCVNSFEWNRAVNETGRGILDAKIRKSHFGGITKLFEQSINLNVKPKNLPFDIYYITACKCIFPRNDKPTWTDHLFIVSVSFDIQRDHLCSSVRL